ncbi:MAG: BatA domain-containing protein, partial [Litorimonas sp.]
MSLLAPLTLFGLLALPLVWWILRISPPAPKRRAFPPLAILQGVETEEETPSGTPWWLLLFRLFLVALAVFALALPVLQTDAPSGDRPLTLVIDDSAASAPLWEEITDEARRRLRDAQSANQTVILIEGEEPDLQPVPAAEALQRLRSLTPRLRTDALPVPDLPRDRDTVFLSSGVQFGDGDTMRNTLDAASATVVMPNPASTVIVPGEVRETADGFESDWFAANGGRTATIEALSARGDVL